ncbi:MAG: hypothetical protein ACRD2Y_16375 [Terriglobales bacterium]
MNANFDVWENVNTSNIAFNRDTSSNSGFILPVGMFAGGDVDTIDEFNEVDGDCFNGNQNPIVYDADGAITDAIFGDPLVIGFAGPCNLFSDGTIRNGDAVLNGLFQDGVDNGVNNFELTPEEFDETFVHEFGHLSGLDHSQINVEVLGQPTGNCNLDDLTGLPVMFPIAKCQARVTAGLPRLGPDDIAWISRLYPQTTGGSTFAGTHGTLTGTVFFSDGLSQAQGVNVIARQGDTGNNEGRKNAVSVVSGFKFTSNRGQTVTADYLPCTPALACPPNGFFDDNSAGSDFGSRTPGDVGLFEIPVLAGSYTVEVETINAGFDGGSSVGPLDPPIPIPGADPLLNGTFVVAAGDTVPVPAAETTLVGTDPRFDVFEDSDFSQLIVPKEQPPWLRRRLGPGPREVA